MLFSLPSAQGAYHEVFIESSRYRDFAISKMLDFISEGCRAPSAVEVGEAKGTGWGAVRMFAVAAIMAGVGTRLGGTI